MRNIFIILTICVVSISCATTQITYIINPGLSERGYGRILIAAPFYDLELKKDFEEEFARDFYSIKVDAFTSLDLFPPYKNYNEKEINETLDEYEIDGILVVALTESFTTEKFVPDYLSVSSSKIIHRGSYFVKKPNMKFNIRLYDRKSGEAAWVASSLTKGNAWAESHTLADSLAKVAVDTLQKEQLLLLSRTR